MSKISRADSKARFRTGMYPTQADFENLHDSYVHKDDTIPLEQVGTNGATVVSLLNQKANSSHTHEIADVNGLQAFITKVNTFLGTVDASDDTINRWKEIEAFLTGITDTETLTGLLANLRTEIVALIPAADNKAYLQLVADLDAYTDAPVGTIVKYTGQTNNKYTHGFDYEKVGGSSTVTTFNIGTSPYTDASKYLGIPEYAAVYQQYVRDNQICTKTDRVLQVYKTVEDSDYFVFKDSHQVGDWFIFSTYAYPIDTMTEDEDTITAKGSNTRSVVFSKANVVSLPIWQTPNGKYIATITIGGYGFWIGLNDDGTPYCYGSCDTRGPETTETIDAPASWQPCKPMSVID